MKTVCRIVVLALLLSCAVPAGAWWSPGHGKITAGAIQHLPPTLRAYFEVNGAYLISQSGQEPPGKHYIDIDAYPEFDPNDPYSVARDLDTLIAQHGSRFVSNLGMGPWTAADYVDTLTSEMSAATTASDWSDLLLTAARLAHYLGDLHNPLHLTENYDGQLTDNDGIHARYEGEMVGRHLAELTTVASPPDCVYLASPIDAIFDSIYVHYPFVAQIIDADTANRQGTAPYWTYNETYYAGMWSDTGLFTQGLFQEGSELLASAWYTAWVDAGMPEPVYYAGSGDCDLDGDIDLRDFADVQRCFSGSGGGMVDPICHRADFDADNDIDAADLSPFTAALTGP